MSSPSSALHLDWCSFDAAAFACRHWHYSETTPNQKLVKIGVWESGLFRGVVLFGDGANGHMFSPFGLVQSQGAELVRVALATHIAPVSQIIAHALRMLRHKCPGLRLVLSFADPEHGHTGGIYQAGGWFYLGKTTPADEYIVNGRRMHGRALRSTRSTHRRGGIRAKNVLDWARIVIDPDARRVTGSAKHRYAMPLDRAMRKQLASLALPYPKKIPACSGVAGSPLPAGKDVRGDQHAPNGGP